MSPNSIAPPSCPPRGHRALLAAGLLLATAGGCIPGHPETGDALFTSPQVQPVALSLDGTRVYVANTTTGSLSIVDVATNDQPREIAQIRVGIDPVGVAVRPERTDDGDELVYVTNHISDSISIVSTKRGAVVQTVQALDAEGVSTTDAPTGIAFAGPDRAFVALDDRNEVIVLDVASDGRATLRPERLALTAQSPRALAVRGDRLYVAAFESMNQTEFPSCAPGDPRGLDLSNPHDQGCEFTVDDATINAFIGDPNIGGRVIIDRDLPDRDVFVFDTGSLALVETVAGVGTLLYGLAVGPGDRVYVSNAHARNDRNGLEALGNRMFENRVTRIDCAGACGAAQGVDLDASAGAPLATPYGLAVSTGGDQVVVTAAGSDGVLAGLAVLDADGEVQGSVPVGAIPQGVALRSDAAGKADFAYVLNTVDSTLSVVDVREAAAPFVAATVTVGADPTPAHIRRGRIAFSTARASTSGTFSCESCHPNGNTDQLLWTINTLFGPDDPPDENGVKAEPRTTMPVRGLRDTLPLHWDGSLADPFPGVFTVGDTAPDCDLAVDGDEGCARHLVDASLSGVMCAQDSATPCATGPSGLPGLLTDAERDDMAAFLLAVAFPPSPQRRPDDALSPLAMQGVSDFYTPLDFQAGLGTCANEACHALPLTVGTNGGVGGFDAPSIRGIWDRSLLFSNAFAHSEEGLTLFQACANGTGPVDPCGTTVPPTFHFVWDPAVGMTEQGSLEAGFNPLFTAIYGVPGDGIWAFINEMSVGLPGILGRQTEIGPDVASALGNAELDRLEAAVAAGKVVGVARLAAHEYRYTPSTGLWTAAGGAGLDRAGLAGLAAREGGVFTATAELGVGIAPGTAQPILWPDPPTSPLGPFPNVPVLTGGATEVFEMARRHLADGSTVLLNGQPCGGCSVEDLPPASPGGPERARIALPVPPAAAEPSVHVIQLQDPNGLVTNELPIIVL